MTYIPSDDELSKLAISGGFIDCLFDVADTRIHGDYDQGVDEATRDMVRYARRVLALVGNKPAAAKPWVGLTNEEVVYTTFKTENEYCTPGWCMDFARAIESALRAKNTGEQA